MFFKKTGNMTQVPSAVMHLIEPTTLPNIMILLFRLKSFYQKICRVSYGKFREVKWN